MNQKKVVIGILAVLVLVFVGIFSYSQKIKTEKQEEPNQQTSQLIQEPQKQQIEGTITYEIPEFGVRVQLTEKRKEFYETSIKRLKEEQKMLTWYEMPEMNIKFLSTPDAKTDLKYVFGSSYIDGQRIVGVAYFYPQSLSDFTGGCQIEYKDEDYYNGYTTTCGSLILSQISVGQMETYEKKKMRPFCGVAEEGYLNGAFKYCVQYGRDMWLGFGMEKLDAYHEKYKNLDVQIFLETIQALDRE